MSTPIISVKNIGKKYKLGATLSYDTLRDQITHGFKKLIHRNEKTKKPSTGGSHSSTNNPITQSPNDSITKSPNNPKEFWALKDISFDVNQGEVIGIIGRNGAGKSTLLKILSEITEPTEGEIRIKGRVASLLEVGTGFHPELNGRENIYLNGAILGMTKGEIKQKFDEIVAFAEVEKFLDTPVKRYSSGMYVRLAFAVAAHLEPEILLVDEVLAVGDAQFQKRCLTKMDDVAKGGRTVLFVSHNLQAVNSLCNRAILLHQGRKSGIGDVGPIVAQYMDRVESGGAEMLWSTDDAPGDENVRLRAIRVMDHHGNVKAEFRSGEKVIVELEINILRLNPALTIGFDLLSSNGVVVSRAYHNDPPKEYWPQLCTGKNLLHCVVPADLLNAGRYSIAPRISLHCQKWIINSDPCVAIVVRLDHGKSPFWTILGQQVTRPGVIAPIWNWTSLPIDQPSLTAKRGH